MDIFDTLTIQEDVFDDVSVEENTISRIKDELIKTLEQFDSRERKKEKREITEEVKAFLRSEISKIQPKQNIIERTLEKQVVKNIQVPVHLEPKVIQASPAPPQIIKEVREVRVEVPAKDTRKLVEKSDLEELKQEILKLKKELSETRRMAESPMVIPNGPGGSGVIGIPPPEPNPVGYVLTVNNARKAEWKQATGGGGVSTDDYTTANVTTTRTLDPTTSTIDNLYNVVGSLIETLQGAGIIQ